MAEAEGKSCDVYRCQTSLKVWLIHCSPRPLLPGPHCAPGKWADILRPCYISLGQSKARNLLFPLPSLWRLRVLEHNIGTSCEEGSKLKIVTRQAFPQELRIHGHTVREEDGLKTLKREKYYVAIKKGEYWKKNEKEKRVLPFLYNSKKEERGKK